LAVKIFGLAIWHYSPIFYLGSNNQFWHQFGINLTLTNDFIIYGTVDNLAFFCQQHITHLVFSAKQSRQQWNSPMDKTMRVSGNGG